MIPLPPLLIELRAGKEGRLTGDPLPSFGGLAHLRSGAGTRRPHDLSETRSFPLPPLLTVIRAWRGGRLTGDPPTSFGGLAYLQDAAGTRRPRDTTKKRTPALRAVPLTGDIPLPNGGLTVLLHARRSAYLLQSRPGTKTRQVLDLRLPRLYPLADLRRRRLMSQRTQTYWKP